MRTSGFISKAACRGYRPHRYVAYRGRQRPHLIARLAKERGIARFIVAPDGYGKTCLALDYAETMFSWTHVFWVNAQSPCFIRDLDSGDIAAACRVVDPEAKLVVIDDLPQLDAPRAKQLSREIDDLLARECEVIVTCTPSCDLLAGLQVDRLRIGPMDLLLNDEELDAVRTEEERARVAAPYVPASSRVPVLAWDPQPASVAEFVAGCFNEGLPADLLLAVAGAFAMQAGTVSELAAIGPIDRQLIADVLADYPHLGFDVETDRFDAPLVEAESLARAIRPRFDALVERSSCETRDGLAQAWAETLIKRGTDAGRACDLIRSLCPARRRATWIGDHAYDLVRCGCFQPMDRLIRSLKGSRIEGRERVRAVQALCCRMLGDREAAVRHAKRCAFDAAAPDDARAVGLLIVARTAVGELRSNAESGIAKWAVSLSEGGSDLSAWHEALIVAWASRANGVDGLGATWCALRDKGLNDDMLCLVASWLFALVKSVPENHVAHDVARLEEVERFVRAHLSDDEPSAPNFFAASAGLSMEEAHAKGMRYAAGPLESTVLLALRHVEMSMLVQRRAFEKARRDEQVRRSVFMPDGSFYGGRASAASPIEQRAVPTLEVKLFGRLEVSIGGVPLDAGVIDRKQARILLVLLVANRGREISRDSVARAMWPNRDLAVARKNFYTTWSQLRRALTLEDGTCPYLVRHHFGCRLEERYVRSDVARFDDICRELLFGKLDFEVWREMYNEIDREFSGDLMPIEDKNELVIQVREDRRARLIDALVTAASRLTEAGRPQWGIWFARTAIDRERTREDAYVALMRAQIACEQRTAAMMTYLNCRRTLAEELGIDPSPEMSALYESLLGS